MATTKVIARGCDWSDGISNAGLGGFVSSIPSKAQQNTVKAWIETEFERLCAKAGYPEISWIPGTSEVLGHAGKDYSGIDLEEIRESAYENFDIESLPDPTADDLEASEIEWDGNEFQFPLCLSKGEIEKAKQSYSILAKYNRAYDLEITDLDDTGYKLYAQFRQYIEQHPIDYYALRELKKTNFETYTKVVPRQGLRYRTTGKYNEDKKESIVYFDNGYSLDSVTPVEFHECEATFKICKTLNIPYPWQRERGMRIESIVVDGTAEPKKKILWLTVKISQIQSEIDRLTADKNRINADLQSAQQDLNQKIKDYKNWKEEMLNK
jgi:outer membrane murein-binding lipoprotein Lpp